MTALRIAGHALAQLWLYLLCVAFVVFASIVWS